MPSLARRHFDRALFVLSVYATLVISNNNERPLAYALPALVPAALGGLRLFLDRTRLPALPVLATVVGLQVLFWLGQRFAGAGMSIYQPVNWLTVVAMALLWLAAQVALRRERIPATAGAARSAADLSEVLGAVVLARRAGRNAALAQPAPRAQRVANGVRRDAMAERARVHHVHAQLAEVVRGVAVEEVERAQAVALGRGNDRTVQRARAGTGRSGCPSRGTPRPARGCRGSRGARAARRACRRAPFPAATPSPRTSSRPSGSWLGRTADAPRAPRSGTRSRRRGASGPASPRGRGRGGCASGSIGPGRGRARREDALEVVEAERDDDQVGRECEGLRAEGLDLLVEVVAGHAEVEHLDPPPAFAEHRFELARERVPLVHPVAERDRVAEHRDALHAAWLLAVVSGPRRPRALIR